MGIEALRLVCMFMVVILHTAGQGGVLAAAAPGTGVFAVAWGWEAAAFCAVDAFALISGYVGVGAGFRYSNLVFTWLRVAFYTVLITAVMVFLFPGTVGWYEWRMALFPVTNGDYWYFTGYFAMFFFIPALNHVLNTMDRKWLHRIAIAIVALFSLWPVLARRDPFRLGGGYCAWWLACLYFLGGYLKKTDAAERFHGWKTALLYVICVLAAWGSKLALTAWGWEESGALINYISPLILLAAVGLVLTFAHLPVARVPGKVIAFLAPSAFSVYLIHAQPLIYERVLVNAFAGYGQMAGSRLMWVLPLTALAIFGACLVIDLLPERLFRWMRRRWRSWWDKRRPA